MRDDVQLFAAGEIVTYASPRGSAIFSADHVYRYHLSRVLEPGLLVPGPAAGTCLFIMLNPSTADHEANDPTVERCQVRAAAWGYSRLEVCNLFALRSTDPAALKPHADPVGPRNTEWILRAAVAAQFVVCAWGKDGSIRDRGAEVVAALRAHGVELHAFKFNADGSPCHPLYLPYALQAAPWGIS